MADLLGPEDLRVILRKTPVVVSFEVDPSYAPFLVSSSTGLVWVPKANNGKIQAAVRVGVTREILYQEVVREILVTAQAHEWGNTPALTYEGYVEASEHLVAYAGIPSVTVLFHPQFDWGPWQEKPPLLEEASWLPLDRLVVVPSDRNRLGTIKQVGPSEYLILVISPSQSIAILSP